MCPTNPPTPPDRSIKRAPISGEVLPGGDNGRRSRRAHNDEIDEGPSPEDIERLDDPTRECPECGKRVYDDASVCYHCGRAFTRTDDGGAGGKWVLVTVIVLLAAFLAAYLLR